MSAFVGIDLGTTNSAIAALDRSGRPEIIPNAEGEHITPSAVLFEPGAPLRPVVGQAAKANALVYPDRIFEGFKRDMATNRARMLDGVAVTPTELSSLVLRKLAQDASRLLGDIDGAVVTVPANFANEARQATIHAGELAGLKVAHIINEPTAALFYYSFQHVVGGTVMVYDFGGGTLDVTLAEVQGRDVRIVASKGDPKLGGLDFDRRLEDLIHRRFHETTGETWDAAAHQLHRPVEEYKKELSARESVNVQILGPRTRNVLVVTRREFEMATATLITRSDLLVDSVLAEAGLVPGDLSNCFLVGGSTRMPRVQEELARLLGREPVCHVNPDEVVAMGAALYSGVRADPAQLNTAQATALANMKLQEVANHYFGTISLYMGPGGVGRLVNSILIDKNSKLPCNRTESYYTVAAGQTAVNCTITQSATREQDPDFVRVIWKGELGPLPADRPPNMEIRVTFSYDTNQVMHCDFEDVASGLRRSVDLGVRDGVELELPAKDKFVVE